MRIDDVHAYLDRIDRVIAYLNGTSRETVAFDDIQDLCWVVGDLVDLRTAYVDGPRLGIHPSVLNKYIKLYPSFETREAQIVAQRVRSYLRNQDQFTSTEESTESHGALSPERPATEPSKQSKAPQSEQVTVQAEGWKVIGPSGDLKVKILALSMLLEQIIEAARGSNAPPDKRLLSDLERAQVITILETALAVLKGPMVETGLFKKAGRMLGKVAKRAAVKEMEEGLGSLAEMAANELTDIISNLPS